MNKLKYFIITLLVVLLIVGGVGVVSSISKNKDVKEITASDFSVGGIDSLGQYVKSETSFISDKIGAQGLTIVPEFDTTITYKVYFYDKSMKYVCCTEELDSIYVHTERDNVKYCRIQIFLNGDKATTWNKNKYVSQLDISVKKKQVTIPDEKVGLYVEKVIIHYSNGMTSTINTFFIDKWQLYDVYQVYVNDSSLAVKSYEVVFNRNVNCPDGIGLNYIKTEVKDNSVICSYSGAISLSSETAKNGVSITVPIDAITDNYGNKVTNRFHCKVRLK